MKAMIRDLAIAGALGGLLSGLVISKLFGI
jgi:hypothetical protein